MEQGGTLIATGGNEGSVAIWGLVGSEVRLVLRLGLPASSSSAPSVSHASFCSPPPPCPIRGLRPRPLFAPRDMSAHAHTRARARTHTHTHTHTHIHTHTHTHARMHACSARQPCAHERCVQAWSAGTSEASEQAPKAPACARTRLPHVTRANAGCVLALMRACVYLLLTRDRQRC